jgi:hypothetical protein
METALGRLLCREASQPELFLDQFRQTRLDLSVTGDRCFSRILGILVDVMAVPVALQSATGFRQLPYQFTPFQTSTVMSRRFAARE